MAAPDAGAVGRDDARGTGEIPRGRAEPHQPHNERALVLLTHRSGLTYGPFHAGPIAEAYDDALDGHIDSDGLTGVFAAIGMSEWTGTDAAAGRASSRFWD